MSAAEFGAELRRMRLGRGWSQETVAERAGIEQTSVSQFERGRHLPSMDTLGKLAVAFDMDVHDLARMAGYLPEKPPADDLIDRTPLAQLIAALETIPEFRQHRQLDQIKGFTAATQERLVRMTARDFLNLIQGEIERLDDERRAAASDAPNGTAVGI